MTFPRKLRLLMKLRDLPHVIVSVSFKQYRFRLVLYFGILHRPVIPRPFPVRLCRTRSVVRVIRMQFAPRRLLLLLPPAEVPEHRRLLLAYASRIQAETSIATMRTVILVKCDVPAAANSVFAFRIGAFWKIRQPGKHPYETRSVSIAKLAVKRRRLSQYPFAEISTLLRLKYGYIRKLVFGNHLIQPVEHSYIMI